MILSAARLFPEDFTCALLLSANPGFGYMEKPLNTNMFPYCCQISNQQSSTSISHPSFLLCGFAHYYWICQSSFHLFRFLISALLFLLISAGECIGNFIEFVKNETQGFRYLGAQNFSAFHLESNNSSVARLFALFQQLITYWQGY